MYSRSQFQRIPVSTNISAALWRQRRSSLLRQKSLRRLETECGTFRTPLNSSVFEKHVISSGTWAFLCRDQLPSFRESVADGGEGCSSASGNIAGEITGCTSIRLCTYMAQGTITSTKSLIEALNAQGETGENLAVLLEWVYAYIGWFNDLRNMAAIKRNAPLQEYSILAGINPAHEEQKALLNYYFDGLCNTISTEYKHGEEPLVEALEYTLQTMDIGVFNGNPAQLERLGETLLAKLDYERTSFSKATYPSYRSILHSLHLTLVLIRQMDSNQWDATKKDGIYNKFRVKLQGIVKNSEYYLIRYHAHLVEQSLCRLASGGKDAWLRDQCRRACQGLEGLYSFWKGAKSIVSLDFDIKAFKAAYEKFRAAGRSQHIKKMSWYDLHQFLYHACLWSLTDHTKYEVFKEHVEEVKNMKRGVHGALCIGVIQSLKLLVLEGRDARTREASMEELSSLAESWKSDRWLHWLEDKDVLEELLECLGTIAVHSRWKEKEAAILALNILANTPQGSSKSLFNEFWRGSKPQTGVRTHVHAWLGNQTLEKKLKSVPAPEAGASANSLFSIINQKLQHAAPMNHPDSVSAEEAHQALTEHYQNPSFAEMPSLFRGQTRKHVDLLQCQLMLIEQVEQIDEIKSENGQREKAVGGLDQRPKDAHEDDLCVNHKQLEWVKTPIAFDDVMKSRSIKPGEPKHEIHKVLLVGNPGTGKTALSRKLAYSWARGKWGHEFQAVYVLPVRALQKSKYDSVSIRRDETLATAIAENCYPRQNEDEEYERFRRRISEDLKHATTLVILDGLDERYGAHEELLKQAMEGAHKLLMLSRPCGIEVERSIAEIEIEHVGLSAQQVEAFIKDEVTQEGDQEALIEFIHRDPALQATAHVPVNLQILCAAWQDDQRDLCSDVKQGSLHGLYRRLTLCVWNRYNNEKAQSLDNQDREALFITLGHIALRGLREEKLHFSHWMIEAALDEAGGGVKAMVDDAGFLLLQNLGKEYQFPHLTFQEYFAGCLLAKEFFCGEARRETIAKEFVSNNKYDARYRVTLKFMAGEMVRMRGFDGIKQLLMLVEEPPQEVVGLQHVLLQTQLLSECVEDAKGQFLELEGELQIIHSLTTWFTEGMRSAPRERSAILSMLKTSFQSFRVLAYMAVPEQNLAFQEALVAAIKNSNEDVRQFAKEAVAEVVKAVPEQRPAFQKALVAAIKDSEWNLIHLAMGIIVGVVKAVPEECLAFQEALVVAMKDPEWIVRLYAIRIVTEVVKAMPEQSLAFLEGLVPASKDSNEYVCQYAMRAIKQVVKAVQEHFPACQEALVATSKNSEWRVRWFAVENIGEVVEAMPEEYHAFQEALVVAMKDPEWIVRLSAIKTVAKVVRAVPKQTLAFQEALVLASKDLNEEVRQSAMEAIKQVVKTVPEQYPAFQKALVAGNKGSQWIVRCSAIKAVAEVVKAVPEEYPAFQEAFVAAMKDSEWIVRQSAIKTLAEVVKAVPKEYHTFQEALIAAFQDSNEDVRQCAMKTIGEVARAMPEQNPAFQEALVAACKDSEWRVRWSAVETIGEVVKVLPEQILAFQEALVATSKDSEWGVRWSAVETIGEMVKALPEKNPAFQEALVAACKDLNEDVRHCAMEAIKEVVKAVQEQNPAFQEALVVTSKDSEWRVRWSAVETIGELAKAMPEQYPAFQEALVAACKDSNEDVRQCAMEAIKEVVKATQEQNPAFQEALVVNSKESEWRVRWSAVEAIKEVVKAVPEQTLAFQEALVATSKDSEWRVRWSAMKTIGEVVKAVPEKIPAFQEALVAACKDLNEDVRQSAVKGLGLMVKLAPKQVAHTELELIRAWCVVNETMDPLDILSTEELIENYWRTENGVFIMALVARLYSTPLVIQSGPVGQQYRLVLYPSTNKPVVWNTPENIAKKFLKRIQSFEKR